VTRRPPVGWDYLRHELLSVDAGAGYVLFGSAVLLLHGLRDEVGDIDVHVTEHIYERLRERDWREREPDPAHPRLLEFEAPGCPRVHAFYAWQAGDPWISETFPVMMREAEMVEGWRCAPLDIIRSHKYGCVVQLAQRGVVIEGSPWEKHLHDIRAIDGLRAA
jgi:hypothetical protein